METIPALLRAVLTDSPSSIRIPSLCIRCPLVRCCFLANNSLVPLCSSLLPHQKQSSRSIQCLNAKTSLRTERRAQENTRIPKADPPPSHSRCAKTNSLPMVQNPDTFNTTMLWAAFCLGLFGFLRPGEFTFAPNFPHSGLTVSDVAIDSRDNPRVLIVFIRTSKTDQFSKGTHLYLGRTEGSLCPVSSMLAYLALRPPTPGPLFIFQDGTPLSRGQLTAHL